MSIGFWQILIVVALVVLIFGRGKISGLMGDVAQGIKSFKRGMAEDDADKPHTIDHTPSETVATDRAETKTKVG